MKNRNRRLLPPLLCAAALAMLSGCGGSGRDYGMEASTGASPSEAYGYYDEWESADANYAYKADGTEYGWGGETELSTSQSLPVGVKMIYTADMSLESTEFDAAAAGLEALVADCGGWFESSTLDNRSTYRSAYYTVRVPAEKFNAFCDGVGDICQVNSLQRSAEDVSEEYYDTESRLITQQTKLKRLQELLAQAEDMESIIALDTAISDTEYTIDSLTGALRKYDSLVGYSTITVSLQEVYKLTEVEEPVVGFGARLSAAFRSGTGSFVDGLEDLLLGFARNWAGWIIGLLVFVGLPVVLIVLGVKRSRARKAARPAYPVYAPQAAPPVPPRNTQEPNKEKDGQEHGE